MIDERDILERELRRFEPEPGLAERVYRRRDRKRRNQRIEAGVVGVIVALATAILLARSFTSATVPANPTPPRGAGDVLTVLDDRYPDVRVGELVAEDPDSGDIRTIVDPQALPGRCRDECSFGSSEAINGAAWSPDRRWVAFRAGGLWVADTVGGAPRQLTADQGWDPWAWSPTKDRLAVVSGHDVTLVDAATGRKTDLGTVVATDDGDGFAVHTLVWSPDGTRIAYDGGPGWGSVYVIDVESGEHSLLVRQPAGTGRIRDIDWSPDGAHLAITYDDATYVASDRVEERLTSRAKALYLANADGSGVRLVGRIFASHWPVWMPGQNVGTAWSPDGSRLAYTNFTAPGDHEDLQVWTVSADGSAPSLVASQCCLVDYRSPVWSPDGSQIALATLETSSIVHGYDPTSDPGYLVVNADGTGDPQEVDELLYQSWAGGWNFCFCYG